MVFRARRGRRPFRRFRSTVASTRALVRPRYQRRSRNNMPVSRSIPGPVADQAFVVLKWSISLRYQPNLGGSSQNTFRANSINDPDFTGGGNRPRYWTEYSGIYQNYQVLACRVTHEITNESQIPCYVATCFSDGDPSSLTLANTLEQRFGKNHGVLGAQGSSGSVKTCHQFITSKKMHGYSGGITQADSQFAAMNANPSDPSFHKFVVQPVDGASSADVYCRTTIYYYTRLFGLVNVASS